MRTQRGGIVVGWLVKLILWLLLLGLLAFEAGAVVVAKVSVDGTTETAAQEAALELGTSKNGDIARAEAEKHAKQGGTELTGFSISQDGQFVSVTLEKRAKTFFIHKLPPFKNIVVARATHTIKVQ